LREGEQRWKGIRSWFSQFFELYREGNADITSASPVSVHPAILKNLVDLGRDLKQGLMALGVCRFPAHILLAI